MNKLLNNDIQIIKDKIIKHNNAKKEANANALINFIETDGFEIFFFSGAKTGTRSMIQSFHNANYIFDGHHTVCSFYSASKIDNDLTIFDLIKYSCNFKPPIILDIYRDNLERSISSFFEFNYDKYKDKSVEELISIFTQKYINREMYEGSDEIVKYYNIKFNKFDFDKKYCLYSKFGIIFLKLRFKDFYMFDKIWYNLFNKKINNHFENQACKKDYHDKYIQFLDKITITRDYYNKMINNENFLTFNSDKEIEEYKKKWAEKIKD